MPVVGVYLVKPSSSAFLAAFLIGIGVSRSGWPAAKFTIVFPAATNYLARALTASVAEGAKLATARENILGIYSITILFCQFSG